MNEQQGHTPPDDPWNITLTYRREQYWWYSADDAPVTWHVSADIDDSGPDARSHVGDMSITLVDIYETSDPFALLDGEDAELGHVAGALFDASNGRSTLTWTSSSNQWAAGSSSCTPYGSPRSGGASAWEPCSPERRSRNCPAASVPRSATQLRLTS